MHLSLPFYSTSKQIISLRFLVQLSFVNSQIIQILRLIDVHYADKFLKLMTVLQRGRVPPQRQERENAATSNILQNPQHRAPFTSQLPKTRPRLQKNPRSRAENGCGRIHAHSARIFFSFAYLGRESTVGRSGWPWISGRA